MMKIQHAVLPVDSRFLPSAQREFFPRRTQVTDLETEMAAQMGIMGSCQQAVQRTCRRSYPSLRMCQMACLIRRRL